VRHGHVNELGNKFSGRRLAHKQPYLLERIGHPGEKDEKGNEDSTKRIKEPDEFGTDDGHDKTKSVDDDIIAVIHLRGLGQ
jgi:hypothetical protein